MDKLHEFLNGLYGVEGVSESLYRSLGHGRWKIVFLGEVNSLLNRADPKKDLTVQTTLDSLENYPAGKKDKKGHEPE